MTNKVGTTSKYQFFWSIKKKKVVKMVKLSSLYFCLLSHKKKQLQAKFLNYAFFEFQQMVNRLMKDKPILNNVKKIVLTARLNKIFT